MRHLASEITAKTNMTSHFATDAPADNPEAPCDNHSIPVCLPVVSQKRVGWVPSDQINLEMDGAEELNKAFSKFPYLTARETATLAERCSLHPDQVKLWFMAQRLHYGISWDYNDIPNVYCRVHSNEGNAGTIKFQQNKLNESFKKPGEKTQEKQNIHMFGKEQSGVEQSATEIEIIEQSVAFKDQVPENAKTGQRAIRKTNRKAGDDKIKKTTMQPYNHSEPKKVDSRGSERAPCTEEENRELNTEQDDTPLIRIFGQEIGQLGRLSSLDKCNFVPQDRSTEPPVDPDLRPSRYSCNNKTQLQLSVLRLAFLNWPYPKKENYRHLEILTGLPHNVLVQWFGDIRYYIKKAKPRWMTVAQHKRALGNIKNKQTKRKTATKCQTTNVNVPINTSIKESTTSEEVDCAEGNRSKTHPLLQP